MKISIKTQGAGLLINKLRSYPAVVGRTVESVLVQQARSLCTEFGAATMPGPGFDDAKAEKFRKTVFEDVSRVFAVRAKPWQVFQMIKQKNPGLAKAYWSAHINKKPRAMAEFLRRAKLTEGLNPADHKAARTGGNGRVKKNQRPVSLAHATQFKVFARKQRALVGFAKAGWLCAAKGLGGRVRGEGGETFPKYVRDIARKFPAAGGARITITGSIVTVEIFTNVKHANRALPGHLLETVEDRAHARTVAALLKALQGTKRKHFKAA